MNKRVKKRRQVREIAIQTLFQQVDAPAYLTVDDAIAYSLEAGKYPDEGYEGIDDEYVYELIRGVMSKQAELDEQITKYLTNWSIERIARIDLIILRLAFYEIFFVSEELVPNNVAVNEAIDLSKTFSDDKSKQFVSGVLGRLLQDITA